MPVMLSLSWFRSSAWLRCPSRRSRRERGFVPRSGSLRAMRQTTGRRAEQTAKGVTEELFLRPGQISPIGWKNQFMFVEPASIKACARVMAHLLVL